MGSGSSLFRGPFQQGFQRQRFFYIALFALQLVAEPAQQSSKGTERQPVIEQRMPHRGMQRATAPNDRLRMLGAEIPDREIDERNVREAEHSQRRSQNRRLAARGEAPQNQIAHVNQAEHQS